MLGLAGNDISKTYTQIAKLKNIPNKIASKILLKKQKKLFLKLNVINILGALSVAGNQRALH